MQTDGHIFIIAEAGVNHNGSLQMALKLVDAAKDAGADAVKFQTFIAEEEISQFAPKAEYQKTTTGDEESQLEMAKKLELNRAQHQALIEHCLARNIQFLSSAFDLKSIELLTALAVSPHKIPSGEITNFPYLRKIGRCKQPILLSTGMATMEEIDAALSVLEEAGTSRKVITLLHCNTEYPTPMCDVNLLAMKSLAETFGTNIGYSDHTIGIEVAVAAVALGATVIEKHLTLDQKLPGPDHAASAEPETFRLMVQAIRNLEQAMGNGIKQPSPSELKNKPIARKSIVASREIKVGEVLSEINLTTKRPGTGLSPMQWKSVIGQRAIRNFKQDEMIEL